MNPSKQDNEIMRALVHQVHAAIPGHGNERDVVTFISLPMWQAWCRATGTAEDAVPTEWKGVGKTHRVYGSQTVVIPSKSMWAISRPINYDNQ